MKLKGNEIPLEARIITVADTYDAMTSDRPYRKGLAHDNAISEIARLKGIQFDANVVDAYLLQSPCSVYFLLQVENGWNRSFAA